MNRNWILGFAILLSGATIILFYHTSGRIISSEEVPLDEASLTSCLEGCDQTDKRLVELIRTKFLKPPSTLAYNFEQKPPPITGQIGQSEIVDKLLGQQSSGFFIECGASTGERFSNSLFFELERNWTGLLVEANPADFQKLVSKNRKAYTLNACLSMEEKSGKADFILADMMGGIDGLPEIPYVHDFRQDYRDKKTFLQCFPTYSVLLAIGNPVVDYFSLDVEGAEMGVLRTIPWDKVKIRVFTIEYAMEEEVKREMTEFMVSKGYDVVQEINDQDLVFVHKEAFSTFLPKV